MKKQQTVALKKFEKLEKRVSRAVEKGTFTQLARRKQQQLARRLQGYALQLKRTIKPVVAAALLSIGVYGTAQAQTFTEQTGANNPLDGLSANTQSIPATVDIDNDGDYDLGVSSFVNAVGGEVKFYENTGTVNNASFTELTGSNNPLDTASSSNYLDPVFVDIDNDGDYDAFIGEDGSSNGSIHYYQNTGSNTNPVFIPQTGTANPLNVSVGRRPSPVFVDIDADGDYDLFLGLNSGQFAYYENTGSASSATFVERTGAANPLNGQDVGVNATPDFADLDMDGDMDLMVGNYDGIFSYFLNTGDSSSATLSLQSGANNPLSGVDVGYSSHPEFVDLDADGDMDLIIGEGIQSTNLNYYRNETFTSARKIKGKISEIIKIYPNPVKGLLQLNVDFSGTLILTNRIGQEVAVYHLNDVRQVDVSELPTGFYIASFRSNGLTQTIKVNKQ